MRLYRDASRPGHKIYTSLLAFYTNIRDLYAGGNLGGIEIYAEKPLGW